MKKIIPHAFDRLLSFADLITAGLHALAVILGVVHNPEDAVRADADAARKANAEYQAAASATKAAFAAKKATRKEVITYLTRAREVLKGVLGQSYSVPWREAGFLTATLRIPIAAEVQQNMLTSLSAYFTAHPDAEVAEWEVTAARATELHEQLASNTAAVSAARTTQRLKKETRDAAVETLAKRLRNVHGELAQLMPDNDPRWMEFGFNVPTDVFTPAAPENLTVTPNGSGRAVLNWSKPANTARFHIWQQIVGVDVEPVRIDSVTVTSTERSGLTTGAHVKFYVTAVNVAGESVPSNIVEMVVP